MRKKIITNFMREININLMHFYYQVSMPWLVNNWDVELYSTYNSTIINDWSIMRLSPAFRQFYVVDPSLSIYIEGLNKYFIVLKHKQLNNNYMLICWNDVNNYIDIDLRKSQLLHKPLCLGGGKTFNYSEVIDLRQKYIERIFFKYLCNDFIVYNEEFQKIWDIKYKYFYMDIK